MLRIRRIYPLILGGGWPERVPSENPTFWLLKAAFGWMIAMALTAHGTHALTTASPPYRPTLMLSMDYLK